MVPTPIRLAGRFGCLALVAALGACGGSQGHTDTMPDHAAGGSMSDGQIAAVVATVDRGEIEQGQAATAHAAADPARHYGQEMVQMHTASTARMASALPRLGITPEESPVSRQIASDAAATLAQLNGQSGAAFDQAYMAAQVTQHQRVLDMLDSQLIPSAHNAEFRTMLQNDVRPMVAAHLHEAQQAAPGATH